MRYFTILLILILLSGCGNSNPYEGKTIRLAVVKDFNLPKVSVRAMVLLDKNVAFAGSDATFGFINTQNQTMATNNLKNIQVISDFRAVAATKERFFMLSIANPALLFRADPTGMKEVYREEHPEVFYDAMCFIDDQYGIAIGDPIEGRLSVLTTNNGGLQWEKKSWSQTPKMAEGEAIFAGSNSAMARVGKKLWIVTGGSQSRVFYSDNKGYKWQELAVLPLVQGKASQGAFSVDFYDNQTGVVVGGDYENPTHKQGTIAITADGGKTWRTPATNKVMGYANCVKYIPNSRGYALMAAAADGIYFSADKADSWERIANESYHALLFIDEHTMIASGNERITLFRLF